MPKLNVVAIINEYSEELTEMGLFKQKPQTATQEPAHADIPDYEWDILWENWYDMACFYEPKMTDKDGDTYIHDEDDDKDIPVFRKNRTMAKRRFKEAMYKKKMARTAIALDRSYRQRSCEDMNNCSFSRKRGGRKVIWPKSRTGIADEVIKRAEKAKTVTTIISSGYAIIIDPRLVATTICN